MADIDTLKARIDLHDLAAKLDLQRPGGSGNYRSPQHDDKSPSLSIYTAADGQQRWKDWSTEEKGDCIDLVAYVEGCPKKQAIERLHELYAIPMDAPAAQRPAGEKSRAEYIADRCSDDKRLRAYLCEQRGIREDVVEAALQAKSLGFNDWTSPTRKSGEFGHGGPAAAFIVRSLNPGHIVAVDMRYLEPDANGGVKTQTQGEKHTHPWFSSAARLKRAQTIVLVESSINALSVESANLRHIAAVAIRGTGNASNLDLSFCAGRNVVICMDCDAPDDKGRRPGLEAAWTLHERLTALNVAALLVDQQDWPAHEWNDVNDILVKRGAEELATRLAQLEHWAIPGLSGERTEGRKRVWLPTHDFSLYRRYRARQDMTTLVNFRKGEEGDEREQHEDIAGFRVAGLSRVRVASYQSTMTGLEDSQPRTLFGVAVQTPRHGPTLVRRVFEDDELHNVERWKKLGPIYKPAAFLRLVQILERGADIGARDVSNFVGLCWRNGKLVVNEGSDCYFSDPPKQCPYHNLRFPSGPPENARRVITAYQYTFAKNAASTLLVWALGAHLKAILDFWPHLSLQADKGAGKSTLVKRLESTIGFTMFSGEALTSPFRLLTSISHTSHPVGWEEISARSQQVIDQAVSKLQETYQYTVSRRNWDLTEYLLSAPVLLAGEDVPVRPLLGKLVRTDLTGRKGKLLPPGLPRFPVRQWLDYLAAQSADRVREEYERIRDGMERTCMASGADEGARRMVSNYSALGLAWTLLCDFAGLDRRQGDFPQDLVANMNSHVAETNADREPWVWILEIMLSEIDAKRYNFPYLLDRVDDKNLKAHDALVFRASHAVDHIATSPGLRARWDALSVKSARVFKRQLLASGVVIHDDVERVINGRRESHLVAVGVDALERYGLHASLPQNMPSSSYGA